MRRGRKPAIQKGLDDGFQLRPLQTASCPWGTAPVSFRLKLASRRDTGGRIFDQIPSPPRTIPPPPVERACWLASVGIGLGLLRSSISRCFAVYYPRRPTSAATSLRSPPPLSQCQNLPASTEPHCLTIAIRSRALPHSFAPRPLKKAVKFINPAPKYVVDVHATMVQPQSLR